MERSPFLEKSQIKRRGWSEEEDRLLKTYVEEHGHGCWNSVPEAAGLRRSGRSCRLRWINYLRPDVKLGNFTEEEERIIVMLYYAIGSRWSTMAKQLPGRTDNSIRNYWNTHLRSKVSTSTRSLFPVPESTDKDENVLANKRDLVSVDLVLDLNWEQVRDMAVGEQVRDTAVAEPKDFRKVDSSSDPPTDMTLQQVKTLLSLSSSKRSDSSTNEKRDIKTPSQTEYITSKLSFSLDVLKQHFGKTIDDAADSLDISRSSLKRICRESGIEKWPSRKRKKTNLSHLNLKAAEEQIIESNNRETANTMNTIPHITVPLTDSNSNSSVTIKATFEDDIIRFKLPLSSGMEDLREKVAERLGLKVGSFKLKYKDDAGDLVLITCDEDLQDFVDSSSRSLDNATIAMLVLPLTNPTHAHP